MTNMRMLGQRAATRREFEKRRKGQPARLGDQTVASVGDGHNRRDEAVLASILASCA